MPERKSPDREVPASEKVRVGVYTCHCGGNISHVVQCERVAEILGAMPDVAVARTDPSFCSDAGQAIIEQDIKNLGINRVVIGACTPSLHEQTFRNAVTRAGLNPYLYQHVGIREQDSWVHSSDPEGATDKAIRLMAAGVAKARLLAPLEPIRLSAARQALVIGGGVAGLRCALDIARQGVRVTVVEKSPFLGGRMAQLTSVFPTDEDPLQLLHDLIREVAAHPDITVLTQSEVTGLSGYVGNFSVRVTQHSRGVEQAAAEALMAACTQETPDELNYGLTQRKVIYRPYPESYPATPAVDWEHYDGKPLSVGGEAVVLKDEPQIHELTAGAIAIATGFDPYEPRHGELGYGEIPEVVTLPQLIRILSRLREGEPLTWNNHPVRDMALIHCVGSRELDGVHEPQADGQVNSYCSRVCCTASLHTAVELRQRFPKLNIYELYQDIRTYGRGHEEIYRRALSSMVRFLRYRGTERPEVAAAPAGDTHPVLVRVKDTLSCGEEIGVPVDLVVLAVGMMPRQTDDLVSMLKVSRGADRFLLEAHPKLRPVEMAARGIVLAGTAQGPMNINESLSAASAAAAKVAALLGQGRVELPPFVALVDAGKCDGTGACVRACQEEGAIALQGFEEDGREVRRAVVTPANCTGCGACVGVCPNRAIDVQAWTLAQYEAMVDAITAEIPTMAEAHE
jgi:heterodisulfide reductase subunit A2